MQTLLIIFLWYHCSAKKIIPEEDYADGEGAELQGFDYDVNSHTWKYYGVEN